MVVVDLPGHGKSELDRPFTLELAAEAVSRAIAEAGLDRPVLVAHSMGGPVAFKVIEQDGADSFSHFVAIATSAYWVRPRARAMLAMGPYVMAPGSPVLIHRESRELRHWPDNAPHIAWAYTRRPVRRLLYEASVALRGFDARDWLDFSLPPTTWLVATNDRVLRPVHQRASAALFDADVVEMDADHSIVLRDPDAVLEVL
jgi:pimeloyl-ACP methyl ester carboxylesterase